MYRDYIMALKDNSKSSPLNVKCFLLDDLLVCQIPVLYNFDGK